MTLEERIAKLESEAKRLRKEKAEKERKNRDEIYRLIGKGIAQYYADKTEGNPEEITKEALKFVPKFLQKKEAEKLRKLLTETPLRLRAKKEKKEPIQSQPSQTIQTEQRQGEERISGNPARPYTS